MTVKSIPYSELDFSKIVNAVVEDGVVIVTNVLSPEEVEECRQGLHHDLKEHFGVVADKTKKFHSQDTSLEDTAYLMEKFQTHPSGGLPFHFSKWRMKHCCFNKKVLNITRALWEETYGQGDSYSPECRDSLESSNIGSKLCAEEVNKYHGVLEPISQCSVNDSLPTSRLDMAGRPLWGTPYGRFLCNDDTGQLTAFPYIDSLNFRLPTSLASYTSKKGKKIRFQRHIAAHADVNYWNMFGGKKGRTRWRPFQSFLALTDNMKTRDEDYMAGGLEVVAGFHKEASKFFSNIPDGYGQSNDHFKYNREFCGSVKMAEKNDTDNGKNKDKTFESIRARFEGLHYPAGSLVLWDWRIPHRQQERHDGIEAREVVYTSFLPDINVPSTIANERGETKGTTSVRVNKIYAEKQLLAFVEGRFPPDFTSDSLNKKWNGKVPGWKKEDVEDLLGQTLTEEQIKNHTLEASNTSPNTVAREASDTRYRRRHVHVAGCDLKALPSRHSKKINEEHKNTFGIDKKSTLQSDATQERKFNRHLMGMR